MMTKGCQAGARRRRMTAAVITGLATVVGNRARRRRSCPERPWLDAPMARAPERPPPDGRMARAGWPDGASPISRAPLWPDGPSAPGMSAPWPEPPRRPPRAVTDRRWQTAVARSLGRSGGRGPAGRLGIRPWHLLRSRSSSPATTSWLGCSASATSSCARWRRRSVTGRTSTSGATRSPSRVPRPNAPASSSRSSCCSSSEATSSTRPTSGTPSTWSWQTSAPRRS